MIGQVRYADTNQIVPNCTAQNHVAGDNVVAQAQNLYKFAFLRGCVGAPNESPRAAAACTAETTAGCVCPAIIGPQEPT